MSVTVPSFAELAQHGAANIWILIPSALLLGALHGLEPGHSKTMMAAFIVAIRGTVAQALLLGIAATVSHTLVVWIVALGGMYFWQNLKAQNIEPYFQLASAVIVILMGFWMLWRVQRNRSRPIMAGASHDHVHDLEVRHVDTGHGLLQVEIFEEGVPPRWRITMAEGQAWSAEDVTLVTARAGGARQTFRFLDRGQYLESIDEIPEPHEFSAQLILDHGRHAHVYELNFVEAHGHDHSHSASVEAHDHDTSSAEYLDPHAMAHAKNIRYRFAGQEITTKQIIIFGLTGGLIPCPASITVLLLCLQLKKLLLGAVLVFCFSVGLAATLAMVGVAAALGVGYSSKHFDWFGRAAQRAPYFSSVLIIIVGLYAAYQAYLGLAAHAVA